MYIQVHVTCIHNVLPASFCIFLHLPPAPPEPSRFPPGCPATPSCRSKSLDLWCPDRSNRWEALGPSASGSSCHRWKGESQRHQSDLQTTYAKQSAVAASLNHTQPKDPQKHAKIVARMLEELPFHVFRMVCQYLFVLFGTSASTTCGTTRLAFCDSGVDWKSSA